MFHFRIPRSRSFSPRLTFLGTDTAPTCARQNKIGAAGATCWARIVHGGRGGNGAGHGGNMKRKKETVTDRLARIEAQLAVLEGLVRQLAALAVPPHLHGIEKR